MVFHRSLNNSKSPQVYRTLLSILGDLNCSTMWVGAKPDKGFLDMKSRRIWKWEGDVREAVDGGPRRGQLMTRPSRGQLALDSREASSRELAWNHGQGQLTLDTGAERRGSMG